ncbi:MAG: hypothetical protein ACKODX_21915, partial [Gemmata sp.]
FTVLGAGVLLALTSLGLQVGAVPWAAPVFGLAAVLILAGVLGLLIDMQKEEPPEAVVAADTAPRELNVYKKHDCRVTKELTDRFIETELSLLEGIRGQSIPADLDAHSRLTAAADGAGDPADAFRARCYSLMFLAEAFHKARHKQEAFRPNWTHGQKGHKPPEGPAASGA